MASRPIPLDPYSAAGIPLRPHGEPVPSFEDLFAATHKAAPAHKIQISRHHVYPFDGPVPSLHICWAEVSGSPDLSHPPRLTAPSWPDKDLLYAVDICGSIQRAIRAQMADPGHHICRDAVLAQAIAERLTRAEAYHYNAKVYIALLHQRLGQVAFDHPEHPALQGRPPFDCLLPHDLDG